MSLSRLILVALLGLPSSADVSRLPPHGEVKANLALAKEHVAWLESVVRLGPEWKGERYYDWLAAARRRARVWDLLDDVLAHPECCELSRRTWLREVRGLMGLDDYHAGRWPYPWPLEYFTEIAK